MKISRWICDVRIGCAAVYYAKNELICLSDISENSAFYVAGKRAEDDSWEVNLTAIKVAKKLTKYLNKHQILPEDIGIKKAD